MQQTVNAAEAKKQEPVDELEAAKRRRGEFLDSIRRYKRKLAYKLEEQEAIKKLADMSKKNTKNIGYLRRRKENIEFRISTEAYTLDEERELIRRKNEVDAELEEAIKSYRLRRKQEYIVSDIAELTKRIAEAEAALGEAEKKLSEIYASYRKKQDWEPRRKEERKHTEPRHDEISLADMAIIKDRKEEKEKEDA